MAIRKGGHFFIPKSKMGPQPFRGDPFSIPSKNDPDNHQIAVPFDAADITNSYCCDVLFTACDPEKSSSGRP